MLERMDRCSPFLWAGVLLQALAVLLVVGGFGYVGQFIPDGPERMSGKGITYTPQTVYHTRILILAGGGTLLAAVLSLVGLLEGPRNRRCIICGAPSIAVVALPLIAWVVAFLIVKVRNAL